MAFEVRSGGTLSKLVFPSIRLACAPSGSPTLLWSQDFGASVYPIRTDGTFTVDESGTGAVLGMPAPYRVVVTGRLTIGRPELSRAIIDGTMADWEIVVSAREYEPAGGRDATVGWAFDIERDGVCRTISVEVARSLAVSDKSAAPDDVRRALTTRGSSAVMAVLDRDVPPRRLLLDPRGIAEIA